jgi:hypothetical protein
MNSPLPFVRPEATTWSVEDILRRAKKGQLYIPIFQRSFRWEADDVCKLFDSIYRGYPVGDLLLWETERTDGSATSFGPVGFTPARGRGFVIIDGQQRVTSLVAALLGGDTESSKFNLSFDLEARRFVHPRSRGTPPETWLPLSEVSDTVRFLEWLQARKLPNELVTSANLLVRSLRDYRLPVYVVHTDDEKQIREIFERLNTTGKRLTATEIFAALQRGRQGADLRELAIEFKELGFGTLDEDWLLKAVAAILGVDVTKNLGETLHGIETGRIGEGISDAAQSIRRVVQFLRQDASIAHIELLPYRFPLVPLTKFFHLNPQPSDRSRKHLAAWLWRGALSQAHGRSDAPAIRAALARVTEDEEATVRRLLVNTPRPTQRLELQRHDFRSAGTKIACALLAAHKPRHLITGQVIDVPALLNETGAGSFQPIIRKRVEGSSGTENRLLHERLELPMTDALTRASDDVLESHGVFADACMALFDGNEGEFLRLRHQYLEWLLEKMIKQFVDLDEPESEV